MVDVVKSLTAVPNSNTPWPPDKKVWSGGLAGIVTWLILWGLSLRGIVVDPNLQGLLTLGIGYAVSYLVPPALRDVVARVNNDIVKIANADPTNPTQAVVVDATTSRAAAVKDVMAGVVPAEHT